MVTADTADQLNSLGIKFDVLVGDDAGYLQEDIKQVSPQGNSLIDTALKYLVANGYPAVNVVTDELDLNDYLPYASRINIVLFNADKKIYPITSGFAKWKPAGEIIAVMSEVADLSFAGLEVIGESQYKTQKDGLITLNFTTPFIFIAESIV